MPKPGDILGTCAMCGAALIRNKPLSRAISLPGVGVPDKAYYPDAGFQLTAVWCPACGLIHSLQSPDLGFSWANPEAEEARRQQAKPPATNPENTI